MIKKLVTGYIKPRDLESDTLFLGPSSYGCSGDFLSKPDVPFESIESVTVLFFADRHPLIRHIFKQLDGLLKLGGKFEIQVTDSIGHGNGTRSISQIKHEFALCTHGRYRMSSESGSGVITLVYEKKYSILLPQDSITRWSFGIITDGNKNDQVHDLIKSIQQQKIPQYEIIICGPYCCEDQALKIIDIEVDEDDCRGHITRKKNMIAESAKYENLVILHDRYLFPDDWYKNMKNYGNAFELLAIPNIGPSGGRVNDWPVFEGLPSHPFIVNSTLLPYNLYSDSLYMQGGLMIVKKSILRQIKLDENLYWGELEDVLFSKIAHLKGYLLRMDVNNKIFTNSSRIQESRNLTSTQNFLRKLSNYFQRSVLITRNLLFHFLNSRFRRKVNSEEP